MAKKTPLTKDRELVSSDLHELRKVVRKFKSYKTSKHLTLKDLQIIHAIMYENLGRVKRGDLEGVLGICGFGRDPQIDEL